MCLIRPGSTISVELYTTQPILCSGWMDDAMTAPGSTLSRPGWYHHGMPFCAQVVGHRRACGEVAARGDDPDPVALHRRQVRAARDQRHLGATASQCRAHVRADGPGTEHHEAHG